MNRTRAIAAVVASTLWAAAAAALEISPKNPTECDVITLEVQRSFAQDCLWEVTPKVRRKGRKIDVTLALRGGAACDQALTDRTFQVPIGPFPAGKYVLSVRWSDGDPVGSMPLTVVRARVDGKRGATATFVLTGMDDPRLPPPMAEERKAAAEERAFLGTLEAHHGTAPRPVHERAPAPVFWNELTTELALTEGLPAPRLARAYALTQVAIFDALSAAQDRRRGDCGEDAVAAGAASKVLLHLFPHDLVRIRDAAASRLDDYRRDDVRRGFLLGRSVGRLVVRNARGDGSESERVRKRSDGRTTWVGSAPVLPSAGSWQTWITTSGAEFQPSPPFLHGSADDLRELEDVYRMSLARTPEQIAAVRKWADWPPPTLWNDELNRRLSTRRWPLVESARASAYLNATMFDAFVACWRSKYHFWTARPYMRLRHRTPMFTTVVTTPNFPSYTSGHSTVSAAAAVVLAELFPGEAPAFQSQAAEAAASRFWGGIHFQRDNDQGLTVGAKIGQKAVQRMQRGRSRWTAARR